MGELFSIERPFGQLINRLLHLFLLNMLWLICSIPIITIGASITAVYSVTLKMVRNEEGYTAKSFFTAFCHNFKQATIIWLILLVIGLIIGADLIVYLRATSVSVSEMIFMTAFFAFTVLFLFVCIYAFALLAHFDNTITRTLCNALLMAIRHLPSSILMVTANVILVALGFLLFPPILFLGLPLAAWIHSYFLMRIFQRYEHPECFQETT